MEQKNFIVLAPAGRLDAAGARTFETEWKQQIAAGHTRILVDLKDTRYISSAGLRTLLAAARTAKRHGGALCLCCLTPRVKEIFEMAGFDRVFQVFATYEQAEESMNQ
jgi:anti-sigma B factor antagonist